MFSELVDEIIQRSGRRDRIADITAYSRSSIRECCVLALFHRDLVEDVITADASPFIWTRPVNLRTLRTVKYPCEIYPKLILPGKVQKNEQYFYYGGPTYYAFAGVSEDQDIDIAYYSYPKKLTYYAVGTRPAVFDNDSGNWSYLSGTDYVPTLGTDEADEAARELVTNWLITDWYHLIAEGTLAKIYKNIGDARAPSSFALYKSYQLDLRKGEAFESINT